MIDYIREFIDYHYTSVLIPSLVEILKSYFYNHEDRFDVFRKKRITLDELLLKVEEYVINNIEIPLNISIIKVIDSV